QLERGRHQAFRLQALVVHTHGGCGVYYINGVDRRERRGGAQHPPHGDPDGAGAALAGGGAAAPIDRARRHHCGSLSPVARAPGLVQSLLLFARTQAADAVTWTMAAVETDSRRPLAALRTVTRTEAGSSGASIHVDFHTRSFPA